MSRRAELTMGDLEYYLMRMRQEKEASRTAKSLHARECHGELASAYDLRCRLLRKQDRLLKEQRIHEALQSQSF
jgi:hypothetical protein